MTDEPLSFMARLKRHHIFRVASAYAVAAYILILVANAVFPDIGLSRADVRYIIGALALLFPVALVLGWMFIPPSKADITKYSSWQRLHFRLGSALTIVIVVLVTISGIYLWRANERYVRAAAVAESRTATPAPVIATTIPAASVAVLPLTNESGDPKQQYFSDGLSEELISDLTQINGLKVIGKRRAMEGRSPRREARDSPSVRSSASAGVKDAPGRRVTVEETVRSNGFRTQDSRGKRNTRREDEGTGRRDRTVLTESRDAPVFQFPFS